MSEMFRKEALERLSSPERLDQLMNVVNPRAWLPLATMGGIIVVGLVWSVFGRLPLTVTGQGVLIQPRRVVQLQSLSDGQVIALNIKPGMTVNRGDLLATIEQSSLEQRLEQERNKLTELLRQTQDIGQVDQTRKSLELENLALQRRNLEESLKRTQIWSVLRQKNLELFANNRAGLEASLNNNQSILPKLRQTNLDVLKEKREGLTERIKQVRQLLPTLNERIESRRKLLKEQLITGDALLSAEQEYFNSLAELSDLETQLSQITLEETDAQRQYLSGLSQIDEIQSKIQEIDIQEADVQRQYLDGLNAIDDLKAKIKEISGQEARLAQEVLEKSLDGKNRLEEVRRQIAQLEKELAAKSNITSEYNGRVLEVGIVEGQVINAGGRLGSIEVAGVDDELISLVYFADKDGKQIREGMEVQVTPSLVKRERYGGIVGKVTSVSPFPVTLEDMSAIIGNENIAKNLGESLGGKVPIQVFASLEVDPNTISGFRWSSSDGPPIQLSSGTTTQVRVKVGEVAPISYVIPLFRSLTGIY
jgi:HlyD family secretion protein